MLVGGDNDQCVTVSENVMCWLVVTMINVSLFQRMSHDGRMSVV